jgi:hypothetical protein
LVMGGYAMPIDVIRRIAKMAREQD